MKPENNYEHIDLETIYEMADGEDDFIIQIIGVYLTSIPESMAKLKEATESNDTENIVFYVHKLKGSYNFIGCTELTDIFLKIEEHCSLGNCNQDLKNLVAEVEVLNKKVTVELQDVLDKVQMQ